MTQKQTTLDIGSISTDTLETGDVYRRRLDALIGALTPLRLSKSERVTMTEIAARDRGWDEVDPMGKLLCIADRHCPGYCYVGEHGSDGFGVWPVLD